MPFAEGAHRRRRDSSPVNGVPAELSKLPSISGEFAPSHPTKCGNCQTLLHFRRVFSGTRTSSALLGMRSCDTLAT